jgi:hypothetical protein
MRVHAVSQVTAPYFTLQQATTHADIHCSVHTTMREEPSLRKKSADLLLTRMDTHMCTRPACCASPSTSMAIGLSILIRYVIL